MPWQMPSHRVGRLSTRGAIQFEKLEDRVAVAATATLAAGGIIFDGMPQLIVPNEQPPLPRQVAGTSGTENLAPQSHKPAHHKHKHGGSGGSNRHAPSHHANKRQSESNSGDAKRRSGEAAQLGSAAA